MVGRCRRARHNSYSEDTAVDNASSPKPREPSRLQRRHPKIGLRYGGTVRVLLASPSLSVTLSIDEILRPSYVWSIATDPLEALSAVVKRSSS